MSAIGGPWPLWFPEQCPPVHALPASGAFYRLVAADPVVEEDFKSFLELHNEGRRKRTWADTTDCKMASCSLFADEKDALTVKSSTGATRAKLLALGDVSGPGRLLHTPGRHESHHSWWRPLADGAWPTFEIVS